MKFIMITADITALGVIIGSANQIIPAIAGLLAAIWYGFAIYDRLKNGPRIEKEMKGIEPE